MDNVALQCVFFQPLQEIYGNKEYAEYLEMVESMDKIICATGMDLAFGNSVVEKCFFTEKIRMLCSFEKI